jgi:hypothetical protein
MRPVGIIYVVSRIFMMLVNFYQFIRKQIYYLWNYKKLFVPKNIKKQRLQICYACEFYKPVAKIWNLKMSQCQNCGCIIENKVKFTAAECPKQFWGEFVPYFTSAHSKNDAQNQNMDVALENRINTRVSLIEY